MYCKRDIKVTLKKLYKAKAGALSFGNRKPIKE